MIPVYVEVQEIPWDEEVSEKYAGKNKVALLRVGYRTVLEVPFYARYEGHCDEEAADAIADELTKLLNR